MVHATVLSQSFNGESAFLVGEKSAPAEIWTRNP